MKTHLLSAGKKGQHAFLLAGILLLLSFASSATTYYVSPLGNDNTGTGTLANPWKTLRKATSTVTAAGNIIHLVAGTYTETQASSLAPGVSLEGEGLATTIVISNITGQWSNLLSLSSGQDTNGNQSISGITFDGQYVNETTYKTWIAIWITGRSNVVIHDCKIINFKDRGVIFDGNDATDPHSDPGHYATGNKFYNNTVLNSAANTGNYGAGLVNIGGQLGMEIYNNTLIQNQRPNFKNGWPLKYWDEGWLKGVKIYNNILTKAPYVGSYPGENGDWDFAIEFFNIQGIEIYNNTIQGSIDLNYNRKGSYAFTAWIHHNTLNHSTLNSNFESGIILEFRTESIIIEDNIFNNVSSGVQFNTRGVANTGGNNPETPAPAGGYSVLSNNIIRRNLFSNVYQGNGVGTAAGITVISEGTDDPQIQGLDIYNNTIVAKSGDAPWIGIDFTSMSAPTASGSNINIRNNIVVGFGDAWLKGTSGAGNTHLTGVVVTHNDAWNNGSGNTPSWPGGNPTSYTYNNNKATNPLFVSTTDFRLQPASTLIDAGIYVGSPYAGNAPDGGYNEFGAGALPITLVNFTVKENNGKNILNWSTANEINSSYFSIERSTDGKSFFPIGRVNANGFSSAEMKYSFTDPSPADGKNFYRLAMTDLDGSYEYSKIVSVNNKRSQSLRFGYTSLQAGNSSAVINVSSSKAQAANLVIADAAGRLILSAPVQLQAGINTLNKSMPAIAAGIYYLRLFTTEESVVKSIISQ
ncbi:MAG TPA: T9SS type A sorting domain-containing protein [Ferruginibacter sp.]|nr:T9SS type A sorting domain-containing protein [Ferruginibacter sp.]